MNRLAVSCDDVFEVLTSGPFPRAVLERDSARVSAAPCIVAQDAEIEAHLAACHECRQLAEALRPAVDLIDAAVREIDADLPVYRGSLPDPVNCGSLPDPVAIGELREPSVSPAAPPHFGMLSGRARPNHPIEGVWTLVAALALGIGLVVLFQDGGINFRQSGDRAVWPSNTRYIAHKYQPNAEGLAQLSSLGLSIACLLPTAERSDERQAAQAEAADSELTSVSSAGRYACCVGCHAPIGSPRNATPTSAAARPRVDLVATLASSCLACHDSR